MNPKLKFKLRHPIIYLTYKIKFRKEVQDFPKLLTVVLSCDTYDHCKTAFFYLQQYMKFHQISSKSDKNFDVFTKIIMERIAMYLQDTMDHDEKGFHHSQVKEFKVTRIWPDLTDYVGVLLDIRFPKMWSRGCNLNLGTVHPPR